MSTSSYNKWTIGSGAVFVARLTAALIVAGILFLRSHAANVTVNGTPGSMGTQGADGGPVGGPGGPGSNGADATATANAAADTSNIAVANGGSGGTGGNGGGSPLMGGTGGNQFNDDTIWAETSSGLTLLARDSEQAAGAPAGVYYLDIPRQSLVLNGSGKAAFYSDLYQSGFPWGQGVFSGSAGTLAAVALKGNPAPGTGAGVTFDTLGGSELPVLNDAGRTAFVATVAGSGVTYRVNDRGIWAEGAGGLALVARAGSQAPGTPSGVNYGPEWFPIGVNNASQVAFCANLVGSGVNSTNDTGLWAGASGNVQLVARAGTHAPGTPAGVIFSEFYAKFAFINNAGQVAVSTFLTGSGDPSDHGIWTGTAAGLNLIARRGSQAPGTASGVTFSAVGTPALNDAGQVAFFGRLIGDGVDPMNDLGIWATDTTGALQLVVRTGDPKT